MNRTQRRNSKKVMKHPELKRYVDKFCMDISTILVDHCEEAKQNAENKGAKINFQDVQNKVEEAMRQKGEELGNKVKEVLQSHKQPKINMRGSNTR